MIHGVPFVLNSFWVDQQFRDVVSAPCSVGPVKGCGDTPFLRSRRQWKEECASRNLSRGTGVTQLLASRRTEHVEHDASL
jgi:hypothetical protein